MKMVVTSSLVNTFLFRPPPKKEYDLPTPVFRLTTTKGQKIASTYFEKKGANVCILFSHGNAEDLNSSYWYMEKLAKQCDVNVISYDYTGYGCYNHGKPTEEDCYADIEAVYQYLLEKKKMNPEQVVLYGRSLGSGPSCYLASKTAANGRPVAGLVLHSPFSSVYRVVFDVGCTFYGDKFPTLIEFAL